MVVATAVSIIAHCISGQRHSTVTLRAKKKKRKLNKENKEKEKKEKKEKEKKLAAFQSCAFFLFSIPGAVDVDEITCVYKVTCYGLHFTINKYASVRPVLAFRDLCDKR